MRAGAAALVFAAVAAATVPFAAPLKSASRQWPAAAGAEPLEEPAAPHGLESAPTVSLLTRILEIPGQIYSRISVDVAYSNTWEEILTFPERRPRIFNIFLATFKTWLADLIVQLAEIRGGRRPGIDTKRSATFAAFGCTYVGAVQWFFYITLMTWVCPNAIRFANSPWAEKLTDRSGQVDLMKQVVCDNFLLEPFVYFPVFYVVKELIHGGGASDSRHPCFSAVARGLRRYAANFRTDNLTSCAIWIPGDFVIYAVPMYMRMPLDHCLSFAWTMILSHMRGDDGARLKGQPCPETAHESGCGGGPPCSRTSRSCEDGGQLTAPGR